MTVAASPDPSSAASLPLARLIDHAADCVQAVRGGQSLNAAVARCPAAARPGTQALSFHALRWLGAALELRSRLAPQIPPPAVDALLLTALSLLWPPAEPPYGEHTLVDQAVAAARRRAPRSAAFVNAVLRRFLRERQALLEAVLATPQGRYNHPAWWIDRLRQDWPGPWQAILDADNAHPPLTLRVNPRRGSVAAYLARLADRGIGATPVGAQGLVLDRPRPVLQLPGFADGDVSVQDAAAQLAAPLLLAGLAASPGSRVLDACAAPGGKTAHLLELADLDLTALDSDPARLVRVEETLQRLGLQATTRAGDAGDPAAWWDGQRFDRILLDAPCSAAGIVRRHPDVRWLRRPGDIPALAATQTRLLEALWPLLEPGGRLLYCTCSVFKAEGQAPIDAFLQRHADARVPPTPSAPGHLLPLPDNEARRPATRGTGEASDGFFYALLEKL